MVYRTRQIDMLIQFLYQDEPQTERFQSGLITSRGRSKPGLYAFTFPLAYTADGTVARFWGQIRPRAGRQPYRLQLVTKSGKRWLTAVRSTDRRGTFAVTVRVPVGAVVRVCSVRDRRFGAPVTVE